MKPPWPVQASLQAHQEKTKCQGHEVVAFSFQTLVWPSCFLFFPRFVSLVLSPTPASLGSAGPGPETSLAVSLCHGKWQVISDSSIPEHLMAPNQISQAWPPLSWAPAQREPSGTESAVLAEDTGHRDGKR